MLINMVKLECLSSSLSYARMHVPALTSCSTFSGSQSLLEAGVLYPDIK